MLRPKAKEKKRKPSLLDPFRPLIRKLVLEDELTAERVLEEVKGTGYTGGYTILKEYIGTFRPRSTRRPHCASRPSPECRGRWTCRPTRCCWPERRRRWSASPSCFGFSRWQYLYFFRHADAHTRLLTATCGPSRRPAVFRTRSSTTA